MKALLLLACFAMLGATATRAEETSAPFPPIQYDEVSHAVLPGTTPAPPAQAFAADFAQARDGRIYSKMQQQPSPAAPVMRPHLGFGDFLSGIFNPMGALMNVGMQMVMGGIMGAMMGGMTPGAANGEIESGRVTHFAYYQGYIRFESLADNTATIVDAKVRNRTQLDLAKRQYKILPAEGEQPPLPAGAQNAGSEAGNATVKLDTQRTSGADLTIAGIETTEYDVVTTIDIANGTGSCSNVKMRMETVQYVAKTLLGPGGSFDSFAQYLTERPEMLAGTGCAGKVTATNSGPAIPANHLVLYSRTLMTPEMPDMNEGANIPKVWMVMERGNVKPVTPQETAALFSVPPGFTQQP